MANAREIRRRWRRGLMVQWAVLLVTLAGGVIAIIAVFVGVAAAIDAIFKPRSPTAQFWAGVFVVGLLLAAIVALIVLTLWTMSRTQALCGMLCDRCGGSFDWTAFEYAAKTGDCPHCLRQATMMKFIQSQRVSPPDAAEIIDTVGELNPYAPPRSVPQRAPRPALPQPAVPLGGIGAQVFRVFVFGYMGWLGAAILLVITLYRVILLALESPPDAQSQAWFRQASIAERRNNLARFGGGIVLAVILFGVGFGGWYWLMPQSHFMQDVIASHIACGVSLGIVMAAGDSLTRHSLRLGRIIRPSPPLGECSALLQPGVPWSRAPRRVRFRTQGWIESPAPTGVLVSIQDVLTGEPLHTGVYRSDSDGWGELRLPLDELAAAGCAVDRISVWISSLDGRPWILSYETMRPVKISVS